MNSAKHYSVGNEIIYSTEALKCNLLDYNEANILERGNITIAGNIAARVAFKNFASFSKCVTETDGKTIGDTEDIFLLQISDV